MTIQIGITGGIGSGKSTVCKVFRLLGVPVFEADLTARMLIDANKEIRKGLIHLYGEGIYTRDGGIDRKKLANIIFNDDIERKRVNALIHPAVRKEYRLWVKKQSHKYVIHEAAILFESGFYSMMDFTILVTAPEKMRIERVVKRDGFEAGRIKEIMSKQWPDNEKEKLATLEIKNDNSKLIIPQIIKIDNQLKEYGKIW